MPCSSSGSKGSSCHHNAQETQTMPTEVIHTPPTLNLPNFDAMSQVELMRFWLDWRKATRRKAVLLVGVRKSAPYLAQKLANYACNKATAIACRLKGDIAAATNYESICERIYQELPEDLRW